MKKINRYFLAMIFSAYSCSLMADNLPNTMALKAEATSIVKNFAGILKPKLKESMQKGGIEHAVNVCSVEAPKIAHKLSNETGWTVKRVSLKPRNSKAGPDEFERNVLVNFNELKSDGVAVSLLEHSELVGDQYRYMKAQSVEVVCLACHGSDVPENTYKLIKDKYPEDTATGYALGDVRGAFSLIKKL